MGSYCDLSFDDLSVRGSKSVVPETFISLFQESDRKVVALSSDLEDPDNQYFYSAPREVVQQRLDVMGFTAEAARAAFETWLRGEIEEKAEWDRGEGGLDR
jgi:hypothetical protein